MNKMTIRLNDSEFNETICIKTAKLYNMVEGVTICIREGNKFEISEVEDLLSLEELLLDTITHYEGNWFLLLPGRMHEVGIISHIINEICNTKLIETELKRGVVYYMI